MGRVRAEHLVLAAWAVVAAVLVSLPAARLLERSVLVDDTFYALAAARHIAAGDGSTVDGVHRTNGYQPLWVWLLAGVTAAGRLGPDGTLRAALFMCALATGAAGCLAARWVRDLGGSGPAAGWAAALWLLNPYLIKRQLNGLESALAALLLLAFLRSVVRSPKAPARAGILAGLAGLARVELGVLLPVLALRRRLLQAALAAALVGPWLLWSWVRFGSPVPSSGEATRVWYSVLQGLPPGSAPAWAPGDASLGLAWLFGLGWPAAALRRLGMPRSLVWMLVPLAAGALWLVARVGGGGAGRLRRWLQAARPLAVWSVALALWMWGAFAFAYPAPWHLGRYFLPLHLLWIVWAALFYDRAVLGRGAPESGGGMPEPQSPGDSQHTAASGAARQERRRARLWTAGFSVVFVAGLAPYFYDTAQGLNPARQLEAARWIRERAPAGVQVGVFQSGVIGYYAGRPIVNLDGKVNPEAMRALRDGELWDYLVRERIELFGDWPDLVAAALKRAGSEEARARAMPMPAGGPDGPPEPFTFYWVAYH